MTNEQLRMQMLAGVITEGEYKAKLQEKESLNEEDSHKYVITKTQGGKYGISKVSKHDNRFGKNTQSFKTREEAEKWIEKQNGDKNSLNENFVGMGAINNPFADRKKESYEDAFEHFLSERYETKFENREQDLEDGEEKDEEDLDEGKEVEEPNNY